MAAIIMMMAITVATVISDECAIEVSDEVVVD